MNRWCGPVCANETDRLVGQIVGRTRSEHPAAGAQSGWQGEACWTEGRGRREWREWRECVRVSACMNELACVRCVKLSSAYMAGNCRVRDWCATEMVSYVEIPSPHL